MREIKNLKIRPFEYNGNIGTELLYTLNGRPACARVNWVMNWQSAMMYLANIKTAAH